MARIFQLPEDEYQIQNAKGEVILSAPLLDLYYLIANTSEDDVAAQLTNNNDKFSYIAKVVNDKYNTTLSGGQILSIFIDLTDSVENSKKNITS